MRIVVGNVNGRFVLDDGSAPPPKTDYVDAGIIPKEIWEGFCYEQEGAYYSRRAARASGLPKSAVAEIGVTRFVSRRSGRFGVGLLREVRAALDARRYEYDVVDLRKPLEPTQDLDAFLLSGVTLRDYQIEALRAVMREQNCLIQRPTGSGKTVDLAALSALYGRSRFLYLMDRVTLTRQTARRFSEYGVNQAEICTITDDTYSPGRSAFGWNEDSVKRARVVLCITHMAEKVLEKEWPKFDAVVVDEAHHAKAAGLTSLLKKCKGARMRVGYSGTTQSGDRIDDLQRVAYLGPVAYSISTREVIERGDLVEPVIRFIDVQRNDYDMWSAAGWDDAYRLGVVEYDRRNRIAAELASKIDGRVLVLFKIIKHGHRLVRALGREPAPEGEPTITYWPANPTGADVVRSRELGLPFLRKPVYYLDGSIPAADRDAVIKAFGNESHAVLVASTIFDEGIDLPGVEGLVVCTGEKSFVKQIQRLGRALRPNNQGIVFVFDFYDMSHENLVEHSEERIRIWTEEGHEVKRVKLV